MKLAQVIGRVTLTQKDPGFEGARFLLAVPMVPGQRIPNEDGLLPAGNSIVVFDNLGATTGDVIGYSDGAEATAPFGKPTPCDAYNCAIIDTFYYNPPAEPAHDNG